MRLMRLIFLVFIPLVTAAAAAAPLPQAEAVRDVVYASPNGAPLRLDAYLPAGTGPHPALIYVHGGGWTAGSKAGGMWRAVLPVLAPAGYAVLSIDYRLAPLHTYPAQVDDVRAAIGYVRAHAGTFRIAPDRLALGGSSAGGHLVSLVGVTPCDGPGGRQPAGCGIRAVVSFFGPSDLRGWAAAPPVRALMGTRLDRDGERLLAEASPITHVSADDPPVLLVHGDRDPLVPHSQSERFLQALQTSGVAARLVTVPGGNHGVNWVTITAVDWRGEVVRWLDQYVGERR